MADDPPDVRPESEEPQPLCPNCMAAPEPDAHVCKECGAPLDMFATTDPLESIRSQGWAYRRAISSRRTKMSVAGMWLLFGLIAIASVIALLNISGRAGDPLGAILAAALPLAALVVSVLILRKCMIRPPEDKNDSDDSPPKRR